jgi:hypothetical protein
VDAVAPALIGIGLWLCYEAWTNPDAAPLTKIQSALGSGTVTTTGGTAQGSLNVPNPQAVSTIPGSAFLP